MTTDKPVYVREEGGRGVADKADMERARQSRTCPFCEIGAGKLPKQPVVYESDHWFGFHNIQPEEFTEVHVMVAAKLPDGHPPDMSYDDLSLKHWLNIGPAIRELAYELKITKGRSVYMRIGANGDFNAQTVFHPHFHVVVSDGRPISREMVAPSVWALIEGHRALIESAFRASQPELFELTLEKGTVQEEALKFLWFEIGKIRSHLTDKAGEIRPKFSNKAFFELPLQ